MLGFVGEADLFTMEALVDALETALAMRPDHLVIDLHRLTFCDVACGQRLSEAARSTGVTVLGAGGEVRRVLELLDAAGR